MATSPVVSDFGCSARSARLRATRIGELSSGLVDRETAAERFRMGLAAAGLLVAPTLSRDRPS